MCRYQGVLPLLSNTRQYLGTRRCCWDITPLPPTTRWYLGTGGCCDITPLPLPPDSTWVGSVLFSPSLSAGPSATAQKPTLTLDPPWSTVFRGESVTLMCSTSHPPGRGFTWYHNDKSLRSTIKNSLRIEYTEMSDTGRYQCEAPGSGRSDPVLLTISNDWLILQAPYYAMFEGDPLRLRCYGWRGAKVSGISYYRDGANVEPSHVNSELFIKQAKTRDSGRYHCTGSMRTEVIVTKVSSPKVSISPVLEWNLNRLTPSTEPHERFAYSF
uniref:Ig-like domain-containing protein n=1 Tax=Terrapene triunguis TaxID=2587831 RepID=A0A674J3R4_9SAUR